MIDLQLGLFKLKAPAKKCDLISNEDSYLTHKLFSLFHKYQFVNNMPIFFTNLSKMCHKSVGNQIHRHGSDVYAIKIESSSVEMF